MIGLESKSLKKTVMAATVAAFAMTAGAAIAASPADGVQLDWPIGDVVNGVFVPGKNITVLQDFENPNPTYSNRLHAGIDLIRDAGGAASAGWNVRAAASGRVVCNNNVNYPGNVVVIEHTGNNGVRFYTQYGHLVSSIAVGTNVARGQVIGTILTWPGNAANSHVHFEVRNAQNMLGSCWGPGYATSGQNPRNQGWFDPADSVYLRRAPFPRWIITDMQMNVRSGPSTGNAIVGSLPANGQAYSYNVVQNGTGWWYQINYNNQYAYVAAFLNSGWGGEVYSTEW